MVQMVRVEETIGQPLAHDITEIRQGEFKGPAFRRGHIVEDRDVHGVPVLGVPACELFAPVTIFDIIYPRILAGDHITRNDIARIGHGGLCLKCDTCCYPNCSFGKGN